MTPDQTPEQLQAQQREQAMKAAQQAAQERAERRREAARAAQEARRLAQQQAAQQQLQQQQEAVKGVTAAPVAHAATPPILAALRQLRDRLHQEITQIDRLLHQAGQATPTMPTAPPPAARPAATPAAAPAKGTTVNRGGTKVFVPANKSPR